MVISIFWHLLTISVSVFYRTRDSGFNSEIPSCGCGIAGEQQELPSALLAESLNSGFLAQYGLDGPLDEYPDDPEEEEGGGLDLLGMPPAPSATSINTKRKRKEEMKQATIRQHYYPEGIQSEIHHFKHHHKSGPKIDRF